MRAAAVAALALALLLPVRLAAQRPATEQTRVTRLLARADSLTSLGALDRAEALYYSLVRQATQDPRPRAALGSYLASRGAFLVGATLLDEAIVFGGDAALLEARRLPWLQAAGAWGEIVAFRHAPLTGAARARAEWLATRMPAFGGADSVTVPFYAASSTASLGRFALVLGRDTIVADVDPTSDELVLGDHRAYAALVEVFHEDATAPSVTPAAGTLAVVVQAQIGALQLQHLPARLDPRLGPQRAKMGLLLLATFAPTIDAGAGVMTLRRNGTVAADWGERVPLVFDFPGVRVARPDRLVPLESPAARAMLEAARWTLDLRRGELVLER